MKKILQFLPVWIWLAGCSAGDEKPGYLLSEEKMKAVISDMLIANELYVQNKTEIDSLKINPVYSVLEKHGIDSTAFYGSMSYYLQHPGVFSEIYKQVEQEFKKKMDSLDRKHRMERPKNVPSGDNNKENQGKRLPLGGLIK